MYSRFYDRLWDNAFQRRVTALALEQMDPAMPVVEVGAGTGLVTEQALGIGLSVQPSEPSPLMRRTFRRRLPGVEIGDGAIEDLIEGHEPVNLLAVNVLHLVAEPERSVERLRRVAGPTGRLVAVLPVPDATLGLVLRAMHRSGVSTLDLFLFLALQAAMLPLLALSGVRRSRMTLADHHATLFTEVVAGVQRVSVLAGSGPLPPVSPGATTRASPDER